MMHGQKNLKLNIKYRICISSPISRNNRVLFDSIGILNSTSLEWWEFIKRIRCNNSYPLPIGEARRKLMLIAWPFLCWEGMKNSVLNSFSLVSLPPSHSSISYFCLFMKFVDRLRELKVFHLFLLSSIFPRFLFLHTVLTDRSLKYSLHITSYFFSKPPCYLSIFSPLCILHLQGFSPPLFT